MTLENCANCGNIPKTYGIKYICSNEQCEQSHYEITMEHWQDRQIKIRSEKILNELRPKHETALLQISKLKEEIEHLKMMVDSLDFVQPQGPSWA